MILSEELAKDWLHQSQSGQDALLSAWWAVQFPNTEPAVSPEVFGPDAHNLWRVEELLGDISQGVWAASWLSQIEERAWQILHDTDEFEYLTSSDHPYCTGPQLADWLTELKALTVERGWFPIYDIPNDYSVGRVVALSDASAYFAGVEVAGQ